MMKRLCSFGVALFTAVMLLAAPSFASEMTDVGTPRSETLIMETQTPTDVPGQFNPYMRERRWALVSIS